MKSIPLLPAREDEFLKVEAAYMESALRVAALIQAAAKKAKQNGKDKEE